MDKKRKEELKKSLKKVDEQIKLLEKTMPKGFCRV